jgi:hypothetical protein
MDLSQKVQLLQELKVPEEIQLTQHFHLDRLVLPSLAFWLRDPSQEEQD